MIVDEEGHQRIKGKNDTDHNTLLMTIKVNDARKPTYRTVWNLENKDGWKEFNNMIAENKNKQQITQGRYVEAEKRITTLLKQTIGEKIQNGQSKKSHQRRNKGPEKEEKQTKKEFEEACKLNNTEREEYKNKYMNSLTELRKAIEKEEENIINNRLQDLANKSQNKPEHHMGNKEKSQGMQWSRLQNHHRRR